MLSNMDSNENKSYLTAIARKTLPAPTRWLMRMGAIRGTTLDYGCGKCHEVNNQFLPGHLGWVDGYDPYYRPSGIPSVHTRYQTIICNYVLCVLPTPEERIQVLIDIQHLLTNDGLAFITVRNDFPKKGHGWTSRGTCQAKVILPYRSIFISSAFRIYLLTKTDRLI